MLMLRAILYKLNEYRGVEQLVARRAHNPEVVGSNPSPATTEVLKSQDFRTFFCAYATKKFGMLLILKKS